MAKQNKKLAQIYHYDLYGKRQEKYDFLNDNSISSIQWNELENRKPEFFFVKKDWEVEDEYNKSFKVNDIFKYISGVQTGRDKLFVDYDYNKLKKRIQFLLENDLDDTFINEYNIKDSSSYNLLDRIKRSCFDEKKIIRYNYKPYHNLYIYYDKILLKRAFYSLLKNILNKENYGLNLMRSLVNTSSFSTIFISKDIIDLNFYGFQTYFFPLYLYPDQETDGVFTEKDRKPNLNKEIVKQIAEKLGLEYSIEKDTSTGSASKNTFAPIDILDYIYAVLHSPTYRGKYKEFLKIDFPRVPYPKDQETFWQLVKLGGEIRQIHLLESPKVEEYITGYPIDGDNTITTKIGKKDWEITDKEKQLGKIWINAKQYFENIPLTAWEFYIGGYQPAQKWLKDRKGRTLNFDDILHYQKIIVALFETDKIMKEIDKIEVE